MEQYLEKIKVNMISELHLGNFIEISDAQLLQLAEAIKHNSSLNTFRFYGREFNSERVNILIEALKENRYINNLSIRGNIIDDTNMQILSEMLENNQTLATLDLYNNKLSILGAQALCKVLKKNQVLTVLNLSLTQIDDAIIRELSEALEVNQSLTKVDLSYNQFSVAGIQTLIEALKVNHTLTELNLNYNNLENKGILALTKGLERNQTLLRLCLEGNKIDNKSALMLRELLEINKTLISLKFLCSNKIREGTANVKAINQALQTNLARLKKTRNQTLLALLILLRHAHSPQSKLPFEIWEMIIKRLDFPSEVEGYRTSEKLANFLMQKNIFDEFNKRLRTQQSFRLVEKYSYKLSESQFSFLVPLPFKRKLTPAIDSQPDEQPVLKKAKHN